MNMLQTITPTISSVELVEIINGLRPDDAKELRHDNFMTKIEKHPGIDSPKFLGQYKDSRGRLILVHFNHFARSRAWRLGNKGATTAPSNGQRFFFFFPRLHGAWLKL